MTALATQSIGDFEAPSVWLPRFKRTTWILLALQLAAMLTFSTVQYDTFALGGDFAARAQAWFAIAHGHLNPWSSILGSPFWKNNAEFILWPMALAYYVFPHSIDLLWFQDAALVATEFVLFAWICEILERYDHKRINTVKVLAIGSLVAMLANPWIYQTLAFDLHAEAFTALFAVLAGRALWAGRFGQLWFWVPLTLLTSILGGLAVFALGLSAIIVGQKTRRAGLMVGLTGIIWFVVISRLGAGTYVVGGQQLTDWYGYLTGYRRHITFADIAIGLIQHPVAAIHVVVSRWYLIFGFVSVVGLVGIASPWGLPMAVFVMAPGAVNSNVSFMLPHASFQNWPAMPFVLIGSVMLFARMLNQSRRGQRLARVFGAIWLGSIASLASIAIPEVPSYWLSVDPAAAYQLLRIEAHLPTNVEVVASGGIIGRLAVGRQAYFFYSAHQQFPITRRAVWFVFTPREGISATPASVTQKAITYVESRLGAQMVVAKSGVYELYWCPAPGTTRVVIHA